MIRKTTHLKHLRRYGAAQSPCPPAPVSSSGGGSPHSKSVASDSGRSPESDLEQLIYHRLKEIRRQFGMIRIEMGALLVQVQKRKIWQGRAATFGEFLEGERINKSSAYELMLVADKFFYDLRLSEGELASLADANMNVLSLAAKVITPENKDDILNYLSVLSERDARQVMLEMLDEADPLLGKPMRSDGVSKAMRVFNDLPDDQRIEMIQKITRRSRQQRQHHHNGQSDDGI